MDSKMIVYDRYRKLLIRNQILNKTNAGNAEHREVNRQLLALELQLTSKEIIENTKAAFPKVHSD